MENNSSAQVSREERRCQHVRTTGDGQLQYIEYSSDNSLGSHNGEGSIPLVFLHGWGSDSQCWQPLFAELQREASLASTPIICIDLPGFGCNGSVCLSEFSSLIEQTESILPERCHLVGWSLGGMIATHLAAMLPDRIASLITLATNAKFCVDETWPHACENNVYQAFYEGFADYPSVTLQRFMQLQAKGDSQRKHVVSTLRSLVVEPTEANLSAWLQGLSWLNEIDNRKSLRQFNVPLLSILGEHDALVPSELALHMPNTSQKNRLQESQIVKGAGHAPHLSQPEVVAQAMTAFWQKLAHSFSSNPRTPCLREKQAVAQSFSRAAHSYDGMADLQRRVALKLLAMNKDYSGTLCDLGSGTGFCSASVKALQSHNDEVVGLDLAEGMLHFCREKQPDIQQKLICGDIENLPLASESCDGLFSSMSIQWCENIDTVCAEAARVLKPGGWFLASTLGPNTLHELRDAWRCVDQYVHINQFESISVLRNALTKAGFDIASETSDIEILKYDSAIELMRELKGIGAHNVNTGKNRGLTPRRKFQQLDAAYESYRQDGKLPASYEVYYFLAKYKGSV